jgi:two-component system sensor histidine kinase DesK
MGAIGPSPVPAAPAAEPGSEVPTPVLRFTAGGPAAAHPAEPGAGHSGGVQGDLFDRWVRADRPWLGVLYRLGWSGVWLVFVGYPISDIVAAHASWGMAKTVVAGAGLGVFALLYLTAMWLATGFTAAGRRPLQLLPWAALLALAVTLAVVYGGDFPGLLIYTGVATGWTFRPRTATLILALLGGLIFVGLAAGYALGNVLFDAFMTVTLGATMMFFRAVIWLAIELRAARQEVARLAVAGERLRFSRDLHDILGHSLSVIALKSQVARRLMPRDTAAAAAALDELESVAHDSLAAVREMVTGYRQRSLAEELQSAGEVLAAAGIAADVGGARPAISQQSDSLLAWTVREGVTNILRHSRARHCRITVQPDGDGVRLEVSDDGVGASGGDRPIGRASGSGLRGLAERTAAAGGTLDAGPAPGGGFRLAVRVPAA